MQIQPILGYFWAIFGLYQPPGPSFGSRPPIFTYPGSAPDIKVLTSNPRNFVGTHSDSQCWVSANKFSWIWSENFYIFDFNEQLILMNLFEEMYLTKTAVNINIVSSKLGYFIWITHTPCGRYNLYIFIFSVFHGIIHTVHLKFPFIVHIIIMLSMKALNYGTQFKLYIVHCLLFA